MGLVLQLTSVSALILLFALFCRSQNSQTFYITRTWNDTDTDDGANISVTLTSSILSPSTERQLTILVDAPFYDDPHIGDDTPNETMPGLWDFEVVEVFLLGSGSDQHYLEIELSPKGQYLLLELQGPRNTIREKMPLYKQHYNASINETELARWSGRAVIPNCYLPKDITKFNAYAIHGSDPDRVYMSLFPTPQGQYTTPDYHRLQYFQEIDFKSILPDLPSESSTTTVTTESSTTASTTTIMGSVFILFSNLGIILFTV